MPLLIPTLLKQYLLAMLLFYADYTNEPYYKLIEKNYDTKIIVEYPFHPEHNSYMGGDLNGDLSIDYLDLWWCSEVLGINVGWTVNGITAHPNKGCYQLTKSTRPKTVEACSKTCFNCTADFLKKWNEQ